MIRRILGGFAVLLVVGGGAALTPLFAALGAGVTLTLIAVGASIWRWMRRRTRRSADITGAREGVR